jgi:RNA polymerase sigma-70 factor (ECF subfamily)
MTERGFAAELFEHHRPHLQAVAYSMLGSISEAEDAVQESWLRLERNDAGAIRDLRAWLTAVVAHICLDLLRTRKARREDYVGSWVPEPLVVEPPEHGPEHESVLADSIGLALLVVLENLSPPERLAFVLHDIFGEPFDEIASIMGRTSDGVRQLASRARRRVQDSPQPDGNPAVQRRVVDAFLAAARAGDFAALLTVLAPDVVLRIDAGPEDRRMRAPLVGADVVARHVMATAPRFISFARAALVNGNAGLVFVGPRGPISVLDFAVSEGRITAMNLMADRARLRNLKLEPALSPEP